MLAGATYRGAKDGGVRLLVRARKQAFSMESVSESLPLFTAYLLHLDVISAAAFVQLPGRAVVEHLHLQDRREHDGWREVVVSGVSVETMEHDLHFSLERQHTSRQPFSSAKVLRNWGAPTPLAQSSFRRSGSVLPLASKSLRNADVSLVL